MIEDHAVRDLSFGGRGVGSVVESMFVNPLTRALATGIPDHAVTASELIVVDSSWRLSLLPDLT